MPIITSHLRDYRFKTQLTQEELASKLGVTRQTIIALEQGKYQPTLQLAYRCARLFDCKIEDLFIIED
jgi:putative transcriptional regulator